MVEIQARQCLLQLSQSGIGDVSAAEAELGQLGQALEVHQSIVSDLSFLEVKLFEIRQAADVD